MEFMEIIELLSNENINVNIRLDVAQRTMDWIKTGGKETDPYIKKQRDYLVEALDYGTRKQ